MQNFFSRAQFFLLLLFVFLIPLQTVYIFRQGPIGQSEGAQEGVWQFGTIALYATDVLFFLVLILVALRIVLLLRVQEKRAKFFTEVLTQRKDPLTLSLLCLIALAFLSVIWASDKILALQMTLWFFEGVVIFFFLSRVTYERRRMLTWFFVIGAMTQSILGIMQFFIQEVFAVSWLGISHHAPWIPGDAVVENAERRWLRAYGSFPHPHILAAYLMAGYFFCTALVMKSEKKIQVWLATLAGVVILFGLVLTFSREAWIGLAVGLGVMGAVSFRQSESSALSSRAERSEVEGSMCDVHPRRFLHSFQSVGMTNTFISPLFFFFLVSFITILFSGILFSEPLSVRFGIGGWNRLEVKSVQERIGSIQEFLSFGHTLVRGVGIGQYTNTLYQNDVKKNTVRPSYAYQPVHNVFLLILAELGIAGVFAFVGFLFLLGLRIFQSSQDCHPESLGGTRDKLREGSRRFQKKISGFFVSLRMTEKKSTQDDGMEYSDSFMTNINLAILSSFIIIGFFDHFFWTIHGGILIWWATLSTLDRK